MIISCARADDTGFACRAGGDLVFCDADFRLLQVLCSTKLIAVPHWICNQSDDQEIENLNFACSKTHDLKQRMRGTASIDATCPVIDISFGDEFVLWFQLVFAMDRTKLFRWQYIMWTGPKAIRNRRCESDFRSLGGFGSLIMLMDECFDWIS